jgi:hypothetical protein
MDILWHYILQLCNSNRNKFNFQIIIKHSANVLNKVLRPQFEPRHQFFLCLCYYATATQLQLRSYQCILQDLQPMTEL